MNWYKKAKKLILSEMDEEIEKTSPIDLDKACRDCGAFLSPVELDNKQEVCNRCLKKQHDFVYDCMRA